MTVTQRQLELVRRSRGPDQWGNRRGDGTAVILGYPDDQRPDDQRPGVAIWIGDEVATAELYHVNDAVTGDTRALVDLAVGDRFIVDDASTLLRVIVTELDQRNALCLIDDAMTTEDAQ